MRTKKSYIFGAVTIGAVLGFAAYSIYEYKKLQKQQEEAITVEQARKELEDYQNREIEEKYETGELEGFREEMIEMGPDEYENPQEYTEEDSTLRHDPNSQEAREQFIMMNLAEWRPGTETFESLLYLFSFPFVPVHRGDVLLREKLIDDREQFFGEDSKWNTRVSYAEVVLYYAREAMFNLDSSLDFWVELFLENIDIHHLMTSETVDERLEDLNRHYFFNEDTGGFGLFGLDADGLDEAYEMADNQVDTDITYEIQFNVFLKHIE